MNLTFFQGSIAKGPVAVSTFGFPAQSPTENYIPAGSLVSNSRNCRHSATAPALGPYRFHQGRRRPGQAGFRPPLLPLFRDESTSRQPGSGGTSLQTVRELESCSERLPPLRRWLTAH